MYPIQLTAPMAQELTDAGFSALDTPAAVSQAIEATEGTALLVINSVCGCAAANARPGARMAIQHNVRPDRLFTVFAGVDIEAVEKARELLVPNPPSSPSIALFKNGELVHFIPRHQIEGRTAGLIADNLKAAFEAHCQ